MVKVLLHYQLVDDSARRKREWGNKCMLSEKEKNPISLTERFFCMQMLWKETSFHFSLSLSFSSLSPLLSSPTEAKKWWVCQWDENRRSALQRKQTVEYSLRHEPRTMAILMRPGQGLPSLDSTPSFYPSRSAWVGICRRQPCLITYLHGRKNGCWKCLEKRWSILIHVYFLSSDTSYAVRETLVVRSEQNSLFQPTTIDTTVHSTSSGQAELDFTHAKNHPGVCYRIKSIDQQYQRSWRPVEERSIQLWHTGAFAFLADLRLSYWSCLVHISDRQSPFGKGSLFQTLPSIANGSNCSVPGLEYEQDFPIAR